MKVFVTGSTGYLGSVLVSRLTKEDNVEIVFALFRKKEKANELKNRVHDAEKLKLVEGDLRDFKFDFTDIDLLIHAAAVHDVAWVEQNMAEAIDINIGGTQRLIDATVKFKIPNFIFISSYSVYMNQNQKNQFVNETVMPMPNIAKAMTKYAGEVLIKNLVNSSSRYVVLRPSYIYGVGVLPRWSDFTTNFAKLVCNGDLLPVYGDGNQIVDLIHVRDLSDCIINFIKAPKKVWNQVYNVGGGKSPDINYLSDIYIKMATELGLTATTKYFVKTKSYTQSQGISLPVLNNAKLQANLKWKPSISIEKGVKELVMETMHQDLK